MIGILFHLFLAAADFNHDQQSEIVVAYNDLDDIHVFGAYTNVIFTNSTKYSTSLRSRSLAGGDFNQP